MSLQYVVNMAFRDDAILTNNLCPLKALVWKLSLHVASQVYRFSTDFFH